MTKPIQALRCVRQQFFLTQVSMLLHQANLDIQYAEGISFPTPNIYYRCSGISKTIVLLSHVSFTQYGRISSI